ncbi:hypothetical protein LWI29_034511 [Acer saccharum]|uniref:EF-hand domain-containing protein n=1 Tax=Acer saccharum TaxID=4024 RepID=A0AA39W3H3_ACESA|nr:hypothetical protein LWI29_034511 [Acer saccharum]KAK1583362.1 hypothetical protein Q3G72_023013 [Acer saccharum]
MSVGHLTGSTLMKFIENKDAFENCVNEYFKRVDASGKGGISRDMLCKGFGGFFVPESEPQSKEEIERVCDTVFERFDKDRNGKIDHGEFRSLLREIMLAMAQGLGNTVVLVYLDRDGLLSRAIKHESAREN